MKKSKLLTKLILTTSALAVSGIILSSVAWFATGNATVNSSVESEIKGIAGYFDSNTVDEAGGTDGNGAGTAENPFVISRPVHLHNLMRLYNDSSAYTLLTGKIFEVGKELDDSGVKKVYEYEDDGDLVESSYVTTLNMACFSTNFRPIGYNTTRSFKSTIIGNDIILDNLTVSCGGKATGGYSYFGFVGYAPATASVQHLKFSNLTIKPESSDKWSGFYAGYVANESVFTNCQVLSGTLLNGTSKIKSNFGFFGNCNKSATGVSATDSVSMSASDITNDSRNLFGNYQYDHLVTRTDYTQSAGTIDTTNNFSTAINSSGQLQDGYSLSKVGHVPSRSGALKYGNSANSAVNFDSGATNNRSTKPTQTTTAGDYFYKDSGTYKYADVTEQSSPAGTYNMYVMAVNTAGTTRYLKVEDNKLVSTTTAPGTYDSTPAYYFSFINDDNTYGISSITNSNFTAKIYSPYYGKYCARNVAGAGVSEFGFIFNSGYNGNPVEYTFSVGTTKTITGDNINNIKVDASGNVKATGTYNLFSFIASNDTSNLIFKSSKGAAMPAASTQLTFSLSSNPGSWPTSSSPGNYTYTLSGVNYTFALGTNVYCNNGYLMMKSTTTLGLPAISGKKLTKVIAHSSSGGSQKTTVGISSTTSSFTAVSGGNKQTWTSRNADYTYNLTGTAANTMYYLHVTTANAQATQLKLTYEDANIAVTGVSIGNKPSGNYLVVGQTHTLSKTITPNNATNQNVTWSSSSTSVATINSSGVITAVNAGTTTITVTTADGSKTDSFTLTVYAKAKINSLNIKTGSTKLVFPVGGTFSHPSLAIQGSVTVLGVTSTVDLTEGSHYTITAPNLSSAGTKTVIITAISGSSNATYPGTAANITVSYDITVVNPGTISISGSGSVEHYSYIDLTASATNVDNLTWSITSGSTYASLSNQSNSGCRVTATGSGDFTENRTVVVTVSGTDTQTGETITQTKTITVTPLGVASISFASAIKTAGIELTEGGSDSMAYNNSSSVIITSTDGVHAPDIATYSFSLEDVSPSGCVTVNSTTGVLHPIAAGTATLKVTSTGDNTKTDTVSVSIVASSVQPTISIINGSSNREYITNLIEIDANTTDASSCTVTQVSGPTIPDLSSLFDDSDQYIYCTFTPTVAGIYVLRITASNGTYYGENAVTEDVTIKVFALSSLTIDTSTNSVQTSFYTGEEFNSTGLRVTPVYSDGTPADNFNGTTITSGISVTGGNTATSGSKTVTCSITDSTNFTTPQSISGTYTITVTDIGVSGFEINSSYDNAYNGENISSLKLLRGDKRTLTITNISPSNATSPFTYSWSSNNSNVTLSATNTASITITASSVGSSTITVGVKALNQALAFTKTISVSVIESISSSSHSVNEIPYTNENLVREYNVYWDPDGDGTNELFEPSENYLQIIKVNNVWTAYDAIYTPTLDHYAYQKVYSLSDISNNDHVILGDMASTSLLGAWSTSYWSSVDLATGYTYEDGVLTLSDNQTGVNELTVVYNNSTYYLKQDSDNKYLAANGSNASKLETSQGTNCAVTVSSGRVDIGGYEAFYFNPDYPRYKHYSDFSDGESVEMFKRIDITREDPSISFIADSAINSSSVNPLTRTAGVRFDITGSTNGPTITKNSISITNGSTIPYKQRPTSGSYSEFNASAPLSNALLVYIPKPATTWYDLGTIHINYSGKMPYIIRGNANATVSAYCNYLESEPSGDIYCSINKKNYASYVYCAISSAGNYVTLGSSSAAYYVVAFTANKSQTTNIMSVDYTLENVHGNGAYFNATGSSVPFTFYIPSTTNLNSVYYELDSTKRLYKLTFNQKAGTTETYDIVNYVAASRSSGYNVVCDGDPCETGSYIYRKQT